MSFIKKLFNSLNQPNIESLEKQFREGNYRDKEQALSLLKKTALGADDIRAADAVRALICMNDFGMGREEGEAIEAALSQAQGRAAVVDVTLQALRDASSEGYSNLRNERLIRIALENNCLPQILDLLQENYHQWSTDDKHRRSIAFYDQLSELIFIWFGTNGGTLEELVRAMRYAYDGTAYTEAADQLQRLVETFPETEIPKDDYEALTEKRFTDKRLTGLSSVDRIRKTLLTRVRPKE